MFKRNLVAIHALLVMLPLSVAFGESKIISGIVVEAECNRPTGYGTMRLLSREGNKMVTRFLKVSSEKLCSVEYESSYFLGKARLLTQIAARNSWETEARLSTFRMIDEIVVRLLKDIPTNRNAYFEDTELVFDEAYGASEAMTWYLENRRSP